MTMRFLTLLLALLVLRFAIAQEGATETKQQSAESPPTTLAEAHAALERILPADELAKIDAMKSENEMIDYHFSLGMWMRNNWKLWKGGPLAQHLKELGFQHPDDMSGVILETFWCKRHGKDLRLKQRAAATAKYWKETRKAEEEENKRVEKAKTKMRSMMMGLSFADREAVKVRMPDRINGGERARFIKPYRDGVFIAVRQRSSEDFFFEGFCFDPSDRKIHRIQLPEISEPRSCVVVGKTAWFAGRKSGTNVLVGIEGEKRITVSLPREGDPPTLGFDQTRLLAVYSNSVFRLGSNQWERLYSGRVLPKSGRPPELHGNLLFLRDEGRHENNKRLWWLGINGKPKLTSLDEDVGVVGSAGPRWENSFSFAVTAKGEIWACVGEGYQRKSLLQRSKDGTYSIAIMNNSVEFTPDFFGAAETDIGIAVSAVTVRSNGEILLVGDSGLYMLSGNELKRELAFENTRQKIPIEGGQNVYHWGWDPSYVIELHRDSYFISGAFGGIYLLQKDVDAKWAFESLDERLGDPVVW